MSASVLKNSAIYTITTLLQKSAGFLLLPVYTFFIPPDEYGHLSVILSVSNFISFLLLMGVPFATSRNNFKVMGDEEQVRKLWGGDLTLVLINTAITGAVLLIFHRYLLDPFTKEVPFFPLVFINLLTTLLAPLYVFYQSYLQTGQHSKRFAGNMMLYFLTNTSLIILLVVVFKMRVMGILLANLITAAIFAIYVIIAFIPRIRLHFDKEQSRRTLRYSLPLVPHSLSFWAVSLMDRMVLMHYRGAAETGIYSIGNQIGATMTVIITSINQAYSPWFYDLARDPKQNMSAIVKTVNAISGVYCLAALSIAFFSKELIHLIASEQYADAWQIIPIVAFACALMGYYHFFATVMLMEEKTKQLATVSGTSAVCSVLLNLLLVPRYGAMGAAASMFASYLVTSIMALWLSRKYRKDISFNYAGIYAMFIATFLVSLFAYCGDGMPPALFLSLKAAVLLIFIVAFCLQYKSDINLFVLRMKAKLIKVNG